MNKPLDISVVIRCSNDPHVFKCIESIDENVEIIVSLTKNLGIQKKLEKMGIKYCITPIGNLSITSNAGFKVASYNKVIITDSDTYFEKDCIRKLYNALDKYKCARVNLETLYSSSIRGSKIAGKGISYVFSLPLAFTPGIAIRKDILPDVGGFLFNDPVAFAVDADLNYRIRRAQIPVKFPKEAYLYHLPASMKHGLKAAYRIGIGVRTSVERLHGMLGDSKHKLRKSLKAVKPSALYRILRKEGFAFTLYQVIWDFFYYLGYLKKKYFKYQ